MYILLNVLTPKGLEFLLIMIILSDGGSCKKTFLIATMLNLSQHMDVWSIVSSTCSILHLKSTQHSESKLCIVVDLVRCQAFCKQKFIVEKEERKDIPSKRTVLIRRELGN